jgi:hypothetical protein
MTAQGNPRPVFRRAIERENVAAAEINARLMGKVTLIEALDLTALVALKDPGRCSRFAARWLGRSLAETPAATLEDPAIVAACLGALDVPRHAQAAAMLRGMVERS